MKIIRLDTESGNELLEALRRVGWTKVKAYPLLAFDKGIDFDRRADGTPNFAINDLVGFSLGNALENPGGGCIAYKPRERARDYSGTCGYARVSRSIHPLLGALL